MTRALFRRWLPHADSMRASRSLRWLGPLLERPWLWQVNRRGIAVGLALGMFFGLLIPIGQALFAGAAAVWLRANLAAAVLATFVSNPFTTPLIMVGGYYLSAAVLRAPGDALVAVPELPWLERIAAMGEPLLVGLLIVATATATLTYLSVTLAWRLASMSRLRRRRNHSVRKASEDGSGPK
jgi:uncharacterized protein